MLTLGGVFATQHNGDAVRVASPSSLGLELTPVVFDGTGVELFGRGNLGSLLILGGFIDYEPDSTNVLIDPGFRVRYVVLGAEWHVKENGYAYAEARLDDSRDASGREWLQRADGRVLLQLRLEGPSPGEGGRGRRRVRSRRHRTW